MEIKTSYQLIGFTSWGSECLHCNFPNKTRAINEGRKAVREGYAFSYHVYEVTGNKARLIHRN